MKHQSTANYFRLARAAGFCLAAGLLVIPPARAQPASPADIDRIVTQSAGDFLRAHPQTVGMSIGIADGAATYRYNFGTLDRTTKEQATADTAYPIASITKTFTASLVAQAALDGKLRLTDDVRKYLDGDYPNLSRDGHAIRMFDLLDHRSGLPFFLPDVPQSQPDYQGNTVPFLTRIATLRHDYGAEDFYRDLRKVTLLGTPGTEPPHYSNAGPELAGLILTRLYNQNFDILLHQEILVPLGMRATCMSADCPPSAAYPAGYDSAGRRLPDDMAPLGPAGDLKSSVNDMIKYIRWQHDSTNPVGRLSRVPRITVGDYSVGLNWQMWTANGRHLVWQSGNVPGFGSLCVDEVEPGIELVILMNGTGDATDDGKQALANTILRRLDPQAVPLP